MKSDKPKFKNQLVRMFFILFSIFYFLFSISGKIDAQTFPDLNLSSSNDFDISLSNRYPFSNEEIKAEIINVNFDILKSDIKWLLNNKVIHKGKAEDKVIFKTEELGSSTSLTAVVAGPGGISIQKTVILRPTTVDLLFQADTYTPYFYKGKSFISPLANATVAAIPHFIFQNKKISSENLLFKWYLNNEFKASGWGKDSWAFKTGVFSGENYDVKVKIANQNETLIQEGILRLTTQNPEIIFYEYGADEGVKFQKAISDFKTAAGEYVRFIAEPYFAPNSQLNGLIYDWKINNQKLMTQEPPFNVLNFSSTPGSSGNALISL